MEPTGRHRPAAARQEHRQEQQLRIAFAMPPWFDVPPRGYGGIEAMAASLADALVERGHSVTIIGPGRNGTRADYRRTYPVAPSERIGHPVPEVLHAAWSNEHIADLDVDIVHDHSLAGPLTAPARGAPTVVTAHCPCAGDMGAYYRILCTRTALVSISHFQQVKNPDVCWAATVHNAINTADFTFTRKKDDFVLFLGRMSDFKGAHLAIDAARAAGRPIVLAGKLTELHEQEYFDQQIKPRLGPDAEYVGEVDMAAKQELYGAAHCLAFPIGWDEPFGLVMIEAMACGTPVVALRRGSVPEIVADGVTGFVCDDPADLPAAIDRVGDLDPAACRQRVEEQFDVGLMAARYERVYRTVSSSC